MKFTVISHAGLYVEHNGISLLFDPWLLGSCYWRSWWNLPEPGTDLIESLKPDFIYITHLHWDHFHGPSLQKFPRNVRILVPKINHARMLEDLKDLGFENVIEMAHGSSYQLAKDFQIYSYQFGPCNDSAAVVTDGRTTLLNVNDTKLFGLCLDQVKKDFSQFDFIFRSHSSASALPYCIENYETRFPDFRKPDDYIAEFAQFCLSLRAKYAIPFASNHCFVHKETRKFNATAVSPLDVKNFYDQQSQRVKFSSECVVMPPGSIWSDSEGFSIKPFDYQDRDGYIEFLCNKYQEKLELTYKQEDRAKFDLNAFRKYFIAFIDAIPRPLATFTFIFHVVQGGGVGKYVLVDLIKKQVNEVDANYEAPITISCHARVVNDCTRKRMFSTWGASKRLQITLTDDKALAALGSLFTYLDLYEHDILPLTKNLSTRSIKCRLSRWREPVDAARLVYRFKIKRQSLNIVDLYPIPELRG